jgi:putative membrane protein
MHLSAQEQQQINGLVAEVEAASGAQFMVAVIGKADAYPEIPWKAFALATVIAALLVAPVELGLVTWPALRAPALGLLIVLAAGLASALLATFVPPFGRLLLDRERARMELDQYARAMFLERGMFQTRRRTGVLILISLFEGEAAILADGGVREQVSDGQIEAVVEQMTPLLKRGLVVEAAHSALTALAGVLRGKLGAAIGANELAEALVQERGS